MLWTILSPLPAWLDTILVLHLGIDDLLDQSSGGHHFGVTIELEKDAFGQALYTVLNVSLPSGKLPRSLIGDARLRRMGGIRGRDVRFAHGIPQELHGQAGGVSRTAKLVKNAP